MTTKVSKTFGNQRAQASFARRHREFLPLMNKLELACQAARKSLGRMNRDDLVICALVRLVVEDFNEVILLAANGSTTGAMKILRGMFERTVTVRYLERHPDRIDLFVKYGPVYQSRTANRVREDMPGALPEKMLDEIEAKYQSVKGLFTTTERGKPRNTWNDVGIIKMAKEFGDFDTVINIGYHNPLSETHPTIEAVLRRSDFDERDRSWRYTYGVKGRDELYTLLCATHLLLIALDVFQAKFEVEELATQVKQCAAESLAWQRSAKARDL